MSRAKHRAQQLHLFRTTPTPEELGRAQRDNALRSFEVRYGVWLALARNRMVEVIRSKGHCTSDDCWALCPPPDDAHPSIMGALFKDSRFVSAGAQQSRRESAHSRWISVWELKGEM